MAKHPTKHHKKHPPANPAPIFGEPVFSEGQILPDPSGFSVTHPSDDPTYATIEDLLDKDTVSIPTSRAASDELYTLAEAYGPQGATVTKTIEANKQIVFHSFGDSGASAASKYKNEVRVTDQVTSDIHSTTGADQPAFLFHLGDLVYNFGESKYYYDQFYDPFRNYSAPILAIPGNHDSFVVPGTPDDALPLDIFQRNFCSTAPAVTPEAGSLHRTSMTQPGVYFTLDAPFVRIIGLFSNALEDPGVISSEDGKWSHVPDTQLEYLKAQLTKIKSDEYSGAVLLAVHHPPFSYEPPPASGGTSGGHYSSPNMLRQIDTICAAVGVYPHAFISGHAHNYQRYTRTVNFGGSSYDVPFVVCGSGGHNINALVQSSAGKPAAEPANGADVSYLEISPAVSVGGLLLERYNDVNYGYLRIRVDASQVQIGYHEAGSGKSAPQSRIDMVTVDLKSHQMVSN